MSIEALAVSRAALARLAERYAGTRVAVLLTRCLTDLDDMASGDPSADDGEPQVVSWDRLARGDRVQAPSGAFYTVEKVEVPRASVLCRVHLEINGKVRVFPRERHLTVPTLRDPMNVAVDLLREVFNAEVIGERG